MWTVCQGHDLRCNRIRSLRPAKQPLGIFRRASAQRAKADIAFAEVAECIAAVQASGAGISTKLALEFLILTATRSGETRGARWSEIDWGTPATPATSATSATWTIPPGRIKAKREHRIPLSRGQWQSCARPKSWAMAKDWCFPAP